MLYSTYRPGTAENVKECYATLEQLHFNLALKCLAIALRCKQKEKRQVLLVYIKKQPPKQPKYHLKVNPTNLFRL